MVIGVIGGGASGMAAALAAAENTQAQVLLFERQARVGRKLQATGNGRCNLSNIHALERGYHGDDPDFSNSALQSFSPSQTLDWFRGLGLVTVTEDSGRVYPYSDQANSVVDVLRFSLDKPNIRLLTGCEVRRVRRVDGIFRVETVDESYICDKVIIACGGLAGTKLGGSMAGYQLLRGMGHKMTKLRPALVQIKSSWPGITALKGVRANCTASILCDGMVTAVSTGEIQFTEYGLSGPVIFEVSRDVCQGNGEWLCRLDFMTEWSENELFDHLSRRKGSGLLSEELLTGVLHNRLGRVLVQSAGIRGQTPIAELTDEQLRAVCESVKAFVVGLKEPMGMDSAQVTAGGAVTEEFNSATMESKRIPGLYACGEVLDVDGDCGGYNLQWAWSSGRCAGRSAGGIYNDSDT